MLNEQQDLLKMNGLGLPQIKKVLTRISQGSLWPGIADSSQFLVSNVPTSKNEYRVLKRTSQSKELINFPESAAHNLQDWSYEPESRKEEQDDQATSEIFSS